MTANFTNVHDPANCVGQACCIHNPSEHPLRLAPLNWRADRDIIERVCRHNIGHPDPDGLAFLARLNGPEWADGASVHGCDGCCTGSPRPDTTLTTTHEENREMIQTPIDGIDLLQRLLQHQGDAQRNVYNIDPAALPLKERVEYIRWNVLALTDELHEMLAETSWKPWAKADYVNADKATNELIDALHFLMNLFLALAPEGTRPDTLAVDIFNRYERKRAINAQRQRVGYDGVDTKCPGCKRALDDPDMIFVNKDKDRYECASCSTEVSSRLFMLLVESAADAS